jgi:hypothetical protein
MVRRLPVAGRSCVTWPSALPRLPHGLPTACPPTKANLCAPTKFTHARDTHPVYPSAACPLRHFHTGCPTQPNPSPLIAAARSTPRPALPRPQTPSLANRTRLLASKQRGGNFMRQLQQTFPIHGQNQVQCTCPSPGAKRTICPRTLGT